MPSRTGIAARKAVSDRLERSLAQLKGIPVVTLSAMTGANVQKLLPAVRAVHDTWNKRVTTSALNRWFEDAISRHSAASGPRAAAEAFAT